jgi:hypothetical protein
MQMKRPFTLFCACIFFLMSQHGFTQAPSPSSITSASPEAATLAKFINFPVDLSTGTVSATIPLFEVKCGELTIPLSLSYHTGGIKINEKSGPAGLGWKLGTIPVINRIIHGSADELGYLTNPNVGYYDYLKGPPNKQTLIFMADGSQMYDENPDEFYYSLPSKSGKFYLQKSNNINGVIFKGLPLPYEPITINFDKANLNFEIKDTDGTVYTFNQMKEYTATDFMGTGYITSWKCSRMTSPTGNVITFGYTENPDIKRMMFNDQLIVYDNSDTNARVEELYNTLQEGMSGGELLVHFPDGQCSDIQLEPTKQSNYYKTTTDDIQIYSIVFRGGWVVFDYSGNALVGITLKNARGQTIKTVGLQQRNIDIEGSLELCEYGTDRYMLDAVVISGEGSDTESYTFEYYNNTRTSKNTTVSDPWGYPGGGGGSCFTYDIIGVPRQQINLIYNTTLFSGPQQCVNGTMYIGQAWLEPGHSTLNCLKSVKYPTGGKSVYTYEKNQAWTLEVVNDQPVKTLKATGGHRIASVKYYDSDNSTEPSLEKYYKYGRDESGAGFLKTPLHLHDFHYEQTIITPGDLKTTRKRTYVSQAISDIFYSNGAVVVYDLVTEYQKEVNGLKIGKTEYEYDYKPGVFSSERYSDTNLFYKYRDEWKYGKLLRKTIHNSISGFDTEWTQQTVYEYEEYQFPKKIHHGQVFRNLLLPGWEGLPKLQYEDIAYMSEGISTGKNLLKQVAVYGWPNSKTTKYFYDNKDHLRVTREEIVDSYDKTITSFTSYPQDYAAGTTFIDNLKNKHIFSAPIEKVTKVNGRIVGGKAFIYKPEGNGLIDEEYNWETPTTVSTSAFKFSNRAATGTVPTAGTASAFALDPAYKLKGKFFYGDFGIPVAIQPTDNNTVAFTWGYNNTLPIVKGENIDHNTLATYVTQSLPPGYSSLDALLNSITTLPNTNWNTFNSTLRTKAGDAVITTYVYYPLVGIIAQTDSNGQSTYYEYDSVQRLKRAKDNKGNILKEYDYHYKPQ